MLALKCVAGSNGTQGEPLGSLADDLSMITQPSAPNTTPMAPPGCPQIRTGWPRRVKGGTASFEVHGLVAKEGWNRPGQPGRMLQIQGATKEALVATLNLMGTLVWVTDSIVNHGENTSNKHIQTQCGLLCSGSCAGPR